MIKKYVFKRLISVLGLTGIMVLSLTACQEVVEEPVVVLSSEEEAVEYRMLDVKKGDVICTKGLNVTYRQTSQQDVSFNSGGKRIEKVYVRPGDTVKRGDILAEVSIGNLEEDIARLGYQIARNGLLLSYLDSAEKFELEESYGTFVYHADTTDEEELEKYEDRDEQITRRYQYSREDYSDSIEFDEKELSSKKAELAASKLTASIGGTVLSVKEGLEGSTSQKDEVIMTIIDGTSGLLEATEPELTKDINDGDLLDMKIIYGDAKGEYVVTPYQRSSWGEKQLFEVYDGPDNEGIEVGTSGTITIVVDHRENVICVPNEAVMKADGKTYVYVLDENNMKSIRWIEVGLVGDSNTEVLSGLTEGEKVVRK